MLGTRFHVVARYYRALFVDLHAVANVVSRYLPHGALVLDVGGGDGAPLNYLLACRPDLNVVMLDPAETIGGAIEARFASRVTLAPRTVPAQYDGPRPDAILIADVLHHVPENRRAAFLDEIAALARRYAVNAIVVKELQPGHIRSVMGLLSDRYVTGDRNVRFIPVETLVTLLADALGDDFTIEETELRRMDAPNYCVVASRAERLG